MSALGPNKHTPADASAGPITLTLPTGQTPGTEISVEKIDTSPNTVMLTGHIRGSSGQAITLSFAHDSITLRADSSGSWWPIANGVADRLNILNYGVTRGTSTSQTAAIKAALDANPSAAFYFPPGDYRLDTSLLVTSNNSLYIDGRIYAGAVMGTLIDYDNGLTVTNYAQNKYIDGGGVIDCALLASKGVAVGSVINFHISKRISIVDPVNRGVYLKPAGAEVHCEARIYNTGTTNAGSSVSVTTTDGSTTVTSSAGFLSTDVGSPIVGAGIQVGTTITAFASTSSVTISLPATASATVTAAILSNMAVESDMGDCTFAHMAPRDFTVGFWDKGNNTFVDCRPWIGTTTQLTARYPNSVGFILASSSILVSCMSDTFRYNFRTANSGRSVSFTTTNSSATVTSSAAFVPSDLGSPIVGAGIPANSRIIGYTSTSSVTISANATASATVTGRILGASKVRLTAPRAFANTGNLTDPLAAASPGVIYDLSDGSQVTVRGGRYQGHGTTPHAWTAGQTSKFNSDPPLDDVPGSVSGIASYARGVKMTPTGGYGTTSFSPTVYGSTSGTGVVSSYSAQSGSMEVRDGIVLYRIRVTGTTGATTGNLRIGALPYPPGAASVSTGHGSISRRTGFPTAIGVFGANGTSGTLIAIPYTDVGVEVPATASTAFDFHVLIECPFTYPS